MNLSHCYFVLFIIISIWFAYNMLIVRRSEGNWQLDKCPLHYVDMWPMYKSISGSEEEDICVQHCIINSNPDYQWYCTLVQCTVLKQQYSIGTRDAVSIIMGLEGETLPTHSYRLYKKNATWFLLNISGCIETTSI